MPFHVHVQNIPGFEEVSASGTLVVKVFWVRCVQVHVHPQGVPPIEGQLAGRAVEGGGPHLKADAGRLVSGAKDCHHHDFQLLL